MQITKYDDIDSIITVLTPFIAKTFESTKVNEHDAIYFLQHMREGLLKIGEIYAQTQFQESQAKLNLERLEARLRLEDFPVWAIEKGYLKATEKDKQAFIVLQPEYEMLYREHAQWEAINTYLSTVRSNLYTTIDDVKKTTFSRPHFQTQQIRA